MLGMSSIQIELGTRYRADTGQSTTGYGLPRALTCRLKGFLDKVVFEIVLDEHGFESHIHLCSILGESAELRNAC